MADVSLRDAARPPLSPEDARMAVEILRAVAEDNSNRDQGTCGCGCDCNAWIRSVADDLERWLNSLSPRSTNTEETTQP